MLRRNIQLALIDLLDTIAQDFQLEDAAVLYGQDKSAFLSARTAMVMAATAIETLVDADDGIPPVEAVGDDVDLRDQSSEDHGCQVMARKHGQRALKQIVRRPAVTARLQTAGGACPSPHAGDAERRTDSCGAASGRDSVLLTALQL